MCADKHNGDCLRPEEIVSFQADEFSSDTREKVERHLASCSKCRDELAGMQEVVRILQNDNAEEKCDVVDAVMTKIANADETKSSKTIPFVWLMMRAAALLAVALLLGIMVSGLLEKGAEPDVTVADAAVADAAKWLISVQAEDGSWKPEEWGGREELDASLTGLAMLTIMSSGLEADESLAKASDYLYSLQNDDGSFGPVCVGALYNHGIATKALMELQKRKGEDVGKGLENAVAYIRSKQLPSGGWSYRQADSRNSSIGVSVWQLEALRAGLEAGVDNIDSSLRNGFAWLRGSYSGSGGFGYRGAAEQGDMSSTVKAMGAKCMLSAQRDVPSVLDSEVIKDALSVALADGWENDPYQSYFAASAANASGDEGLVDKLADMRNTIAHKRVTKGVNAGSWNADVKWGRVGGRVYATSMAALALSNEALGGI